MVTTLKALQDTLGRFQDREVQAPMLRSLGDEVARARRTAPAALMAMGVLVERLEREQARRARRVRRALRRLRAPSRQRALVRKTFAMSRVLATYNIKGGVGKTSAAVNLAYLAARDGARTLLWDLDPQGASTYLFRVKPQGQGRRAQARARQERRRRR